MDDFFVNVKDGNAICVPPSPRMLATYVLLEQEDWFEKEIGFIRRALTRGMTAIDVGAKYGVYTAAIATLVGADGEVWAFEPASATAEFLGKTIARNELQNVTLCQAAVSDREGSARLRRDPDAEASRPDDDKGGEEVAAVTLDGEAERRGWGRVDFVKLDAAGHEAQILAGGARFFASQSPLVMFEAKHGETWNTALWRVLKDQRYALYRLIGPDTVLVPFAENEALDGFELNLFAAKPDRAAELARGGLLATSPSAPRDIDGRGRALLSRMPFAAALSALPAQDEAYARALDAYAAWRDERRVANQRAGAISAGLHTLESAVAARPGLARLSTFARAAFEAGQRTKAVAAAGEALKILQAGAAVDEPFWPACARYDAIAPGERAKDWFAASLIEALESWRAYSGYFLTAQIPAALDWLQATPFASAPFERRRQLMSHRAGRASKSSPLLTKSADDNLNPLLWRKPAFR